MTSFICQHNTEPCEKRLSSRVVWGCWWGSILIMSNEEGRPTHVGSMPVWVCALDSALSLNELPASVHVSFLCSLLLVWLAAALPSPQWCNYHCKTHKPLLPYSCVYPEALALSQGMKLRHIPYTYSLHQQTKWGHWLSSNRLLK